MTVYWDIMFLINFTIDYLVLYSTSKAIFLNTNFLKMSLGAFIGGVYGIFIFEQSWIFNIVTYILITLFILYIVFSKVDLKTVLTFYLISFIFGGISNFFNNMYGVIKVSDGFFYIENNIFVIIAGVVLSSFLVIISLKIINRNNIKNNHIKTIDIFMEDKNTTIKGMIDTGNLLLDPITQYPVILASFDSIKEIIPDELKEFLKEGKDISANVNRKYLSKIRLIPYKNSTSNDILKGFKPDYIVIKDEGNKIIKDVIIAISYDNLSDDNEFNAVLNPQI